MHLRLTYELASSYFVLLMKSHLQSYPSPLQINSFWKYKRQANRRLILGRRVLRSHLSVPSLSSLFLAFGNLISITKSYEDWRYFQQKDFYFPFPFQSFILVLTSISFIFFLLLLWISNFFSNRRILSQLQKWFSKSYENSKEKESEDRS